MSYQLYAFDEVLLPFRMAEDDLSTPGVDSALVDVTGAVWDAWESERHLPRRHTIQHSGLYFGDASNIATAAGLQFATEADDLLIIGTEGQALRIQCDALKAKIGESGTLYRKRESDSVLQWKTARLMAVRHQQVVADINIAKLDSSFESTMRAWRGATQQSVAGTYSGRMYLQVENNGDLPVDSAIITIAATSTISRIRTNLTGVEWTWLGSLLTGQTLTIDCGAQTILRSTVDLYSGFALGAGHTVVGWLPLAVGQNDLAFTGDGRATITVKWYEQFA